MSESKVKVPMKDGLSKVRQKLKEMRIKKSPSPDLIKIIDEVTRQTPDEEEPKSKVPFKRDDIAAGARKRTNDLDL